MARVATRAVLRFNRSTHTHTHTHAHTHPHGSLAIQKAAVFPRGGIRGDEFKDLDQSEDETKSE